MYSTTISAWSSKSLELCQLEKFNSHFRNKMFYAGTVFSDSSKDLPSTSKWCVMG